MTLTWSGKVLHSRADPPACVSVTLCPLARMSRVWFEDSEWKSVPFLAVERSSHQGTVSGFLRLEGVV